MLGIREVKCYFCGEKYSYLLDSCPNCGAENRGNIVQESEDEGSTNTTTETDLSNTYDASEYDATKVPKTIQQMKEWVYANNIPVAQMHVYIGALYKGPKAFGIYKDADGQITVYKNKANGKQVVHYQGVDEEYAVRELYNKMQELMHENNYNPETNTRINMYNSSAKHLSTASDAEKHNSCNAEEFEQQQQARKVVMTITTFFFVVIIIRLILLMILNFGPFFLDYMIDAQNNQSYNDVYHQDDSSYRYSNDSYDDYDDNDDYSYDSYDSYDDDYDYDSYDDYDDDYDYDWDIDWDSDW